MKRVYLRIMVLALFLCVSMQAHAALIDRGADSLGNHLIYDTDLNITWYDYTPDRNTWQSYIDWAAALSVNFNGTSYDDWRLPSTLDGLHSGGGYDGSTTAGYNITSSEMGHLFYAELGNLGYYATDGTSPQTGWGLSNTGPFSNLWATYYWSGTEYSFSPSYAWGFNFDEGFQGVWDKASVFFYGLAVRPGDVAAAAVPEPASLLLLGSGLMGLFAGRKIFRRREG